jgi:integrase
MASVRKRSWSTASGETKETWIVAYADRSGRHIETFQRKREADARRKEIEHEVGMGTHVARTDSLTVAEAGEQWIQQVTAGGREASTVRQYRQHLDLHIAPLVGDVKLVDLMPASVSAFRNALRDKGCSPAMIKKVVVSLGSILANAMDHGRVGRNVVAGQSRSTRKRQQHNEERHRSEIRAGVDFPELAEVKALIDQADGRFRPFFVTAAFTGMRASELRGLAWDAVDLKSKTIAVQRRASLWGDLGSPKSKAARRKIPVPDLVVRELRQWKLACPIGELNLVFPNGNGNVESHANLINRGFDPLQVAAGVVDKYGKPKYGLHALRHFFASMAIQRYSPKRAQVLLGHATFAMTMDTYGHLFDDAAGDQERAAAIEEAVLRC